jgi:type II secretory pathway component PulJ
VSADFRVEECGRRRRSRGGPASGVTLVELLVATCVAAVALAGAWPWLWNIQATTDVVSARAQAGTSAAFAVRVVSDDLEQATALLVPALERSPSSALYLRHDHPGEPPETVAIVWDAARRVLWRKASGTYLADHVEDFALRYFTAGGRQLDAGDFSSSAWPALVARVSVAVRTRDGGSLGAAALEATPGPA